MTTTRNVIEELLTSVAQVAPSVQTFYQWILQNLNIRDGPLENYGGGGSGIFEPQEFLFVIKFLVWVCFRP